MKTVVLAFVLCGLSVQGATIVANSPSLIDVSNAVFISATGDTVSIPAGTSSWTVGVQIAKSITLQGAGIGQTIIVDELTASDGVGAALILWSTVTNEPVRLTGIQFNRGTASSDYSFGSIWFANTGLAVRIDHCLFNNLRNNCVYWGNRVCGVMDHCSYNTDTGNHALEVHHYDWQPWSGSQPYGDGSWSTPFGWGTTNMVVVENCDFTKTGADTSHGGALGTAAIDTFDGARFCIRNCQFTNCYIEMHGTDSSGRYRGARAGEGYMNTFYYTTPWSSAWDMRSGSTVFWSNSVLGTLDEGVTLSNYRTWAWVQPYEGATGTNVWDVNSNSVYATGFHTGVAVNYQLTDTNANWTTNQWVGYVINNTNEHTFSACTANTKTTATFVNSAGAGFQNSMTFTNGQGYEFRFVRFVLDGCGSGTGDALVGGSSVVNPTPHTWPNQAREPVYTWGNTGISAANTINRSYYLTSIQPGSEYNENTPKPGYTPLVYPHPLVSASPPPNPPTGLKVFTVGGRAIKL